MHVNIQKISCGSFSSSLLSSVFQNLVHESYQKIPQHIKPFKDFWLFTFKMVDTGEDHVQDEFVAESHCNVVGAKLLQNELLCVGDVLVCPFFNLPCQLLKPEIEASVIFFHPFCARSNRSEPDDLENQEFCEAPGLETHNSPHTPSSCGGRRCSGRCGTD